MSRYQTIHAIGFLFPFNKPVDVADYFDFVNLKWAKEDLFWDLKFRNLPNGLLLRFPNGTVKLVYGNKLCPLDPDFHPLLNESHLLR